MVDFIKRICIALALATFLGLLFISTTTSFAETKEVVPEELVESLIWPTVGEITDTYGTRWGKHYGIDIAAPEGTTVVTIADGIVSRSYYSDTYGNVVFVEHDNGLETVYAHLHKRKVEEGQAITEGEKIGTVGTTGRSSGNHLHFEVHNGNWNIEKSESIDPFLVLSQEPEYMYASLGEDSPYGQDWKQREIVSVMSPERDETLIHNRSNGETIEVTVQAGDTLWSLASKLGVSVNELKEWNGLTGDVIKVDDVLVVVQMENVHIIQSGETLTSIATNYGITAKEIIEQNQLESDMIVPGQTIVIN
ncbi:peptidoglycan DD-metalloendopeptidase family protein [Alkalihalobacillus sp. MEB130]|uniref:peptidoglycan DD-metalloendopeptidase family protein n=1 Tax=Alkalihalobacillus sp. MEB130 TaxID=2976704 RepID=UPI0028DD9FBC|nr:peptidoglycan DD-metalloendopeptidase family protein [Alkalihalobacillus sp. MEB130]MDT8860059.1 peptidoglycan DD-metalloendopeptidase family protein [Alkalihalobacillus sp. MEB130]